MIEHARTEVVRKPIVVTVGREGDPFDTRFSCYRVGEPGEVFSTFDVMVEYPTSEDASKSYVAGVRLENFPRALGTLGLASVLCEWLNQQTTGIRDPEGKVVRDPTADEMNANPCRFVQIPLKVSTQVAMVADGKEGVK